MHFRRDGHKQRPSGLCTTHGEKQGYPKGAASPFWRTTLLAKSSVLYLLRPLARERDVDGRPQTVSCATSFKCGWENYLGFIKIIREIRAVMEQLLPMQGTPRLIDAHSFVWIIQEDRFINWVPEPEQNIQIELTTEKYIQGVIAGSGGRRSVTSNAYVRSAEVAKETRKRANGICQLCNRPAPFIDKKGNPYLEVHHIVWLSRGGEDNTENTAALCPNCHMRMHVLDKSEDVEKLKSVIGCMIG